MKQEQSNGMTLFSRKQIWGGILYLLIGHLIVIPEILFIVSGWLDLSEDHLTLLNFIHILIITLFLLILIRKQLKADFASFLKKGKMLLWLIPTLYILQLIGRIIVVTVMVSIHGEVSLGDNQIAVEESMNQLPLLSAVMSVILAPLWEEIIFTGFIFGSLRRKNRFLAYLTTSILFGLLHTIFSFIFNFSSDLFLITLIYVPISLACCYIYEKTERLWSAITLHAFANLLATLLIIGT